MTRHASLALLVPAFLACLFAFGSVAHAAVIEIQPYSDESIDSAIPNNFLYTDCINIGDVGLAGARVTAIEYYVDGKGVSPNLGSQIELYEDTNCGAGGTQTWVASTTHSAVGGTKTLLVDFYATSTSGIDVSGYLGLRFRVDRTGGGFVNPLGTWGRDGEPYYVVYGDASYTPNPTVLSFYSDRSATSTLEAMNGSCAQVSNIFAEAVCIAFAFLFVPNPSVLNQYSELPETLAARFPFSYVAGVASAFTGLTASTTSNLPPTQMAFHAPYAAISSTSPFGNFLPDVTILSTTTIYKYISPGMWSFLQNLIALGIWISLATYIFYDVRNKQSLV